MRSLGQCAARAPLTVRRHQADPHAEGVLHGRWPGILQSIEAIRLKENPRNCLKLEDAKEEGQRSPV